VLLFTWNLERVKAENFDNGVSANCTSDRNVTNGSGSKIYDSERPCCTIGDCVYYSLSDAFNKATSNDIINVTSNIVLSSIATLQGTENITISGHTNSTIAQCDDIGAVKFVGCNNITIKGINWERCGSNVKSTYPGIGFYNLSDVEFQNCILHNSTGQAVVLSNVSGIIFIKHCYFTHNNKYRGDGAVLNQLIIILQQQWWLTTAVLNIMDKLTVSFTSMVQATIVKIISKFHIHTQQRSTHSCIPH